MALLGIDIGTTNCKAGIFTEDGSVLSISSCPTPIPCAGRCEADELWSVVAGQIEACSRTAGRARVGGIGICSMAESGLLLDRGGGKALSPVVPWFDTGASSEAAFIRREADEPEAFKRFGIYSSFKASLAKLLWLRKGSPEIPIRRAVWLSIADYIAFRLTGECVTDYSLAGRTYAFDLTARRWDVPWLDHLGLPAGIFPAAVPAGARAGCVSLENAGLAGIASGTPVTVAGHDQVCAAFGARISSNEALDSMGTAEVLIGPCAERPLGRAEYESGLTFGLMPSRGLMYWLGGLSASGASLEWLRRILDSRPQPHEQLERLLIEARSGPGSLLFFPYLSGAGAPMPDSDARAAFIGLDAAHGRRDLVKAVYEGTAYQMQSIRLEAERLMGRRITRLAASGGGALNRDWLQIKADVFGFPLQIPAERQTALLGAALLGGVAANIYRSAEEAQTAARTRPGSDVVPSMPLHGEYSVMFERQFVRWQRLLSGQGAGGET